MDTALRGQTARQTEHFGTIGLHGKIAECAGIHG